MGGVAGPPPVLVRPAVAADAPGIGPILASAFRGEFGTILGRQAARAPKLLATLTELRLARGLTTTFVAERDARVVGVLNIEARREGIGDRWAEFQTPQERATNSTAWAAARRIREERNKRIESIKNGSGELAG